MTEERFPAARLDRVAAMERRHFWFAARRRLVERVTERWLPRCDEPFVDLGCGTGSLVSALEDGGRRAVGIDRRPEGLAALVRVRPSARVVRGDVERIPLRSRSVAAAFLLDVLEHVEDDEALCETRRVLADDGWLVATVPALPWLWSHRDAAAGHRRRYTARSLRDVLERGRFRVVDLGYHHALLVPLLAVTRRLGRRDERWRDAEDDPAGPVNALLGAVCRVETALSRVVRWPIGSSLYAVARKR
jgi:SAM-dependent methyltransferase